MNDKFNHFGVEEFMSEWEQKVDFCFAESGVHPMKVGDLLDDVTKEKLFQLELNYPEVNGYKELRRKIAEMYGDSDPDKVLVTVGASEANYILGQVLSDSESKIAVLTPTYQQFPGVCKNRGATINNFFLREEHGWALDEKSLKDAVCDNTKVIHVVNPNNPSAKILTNSEMESIVSQARNVGAYLVVDEVYAGAERLTDTITPSFFSMYEKCFAIGSMSKAYGLPGLRIGWVIGPKDLIAECWRHHEYVTISASMVGNFLAIQALSNRQRVLDRTRRLIRTGWPLVESVVRNNSDILSVVQPEASAMCFLKYKLSIDSLSLAKRLATQVRILVVPGVLFDQEYHLRFTFALPEDIVSKGLNLLLSVLREVQKEENDMNP